MSPLTKPVTHLQKAPLTSVAAVGEGRDTGAEHHNHKEQLREFEKVRDAYEAKHQGLYRRIYPVSSAAPSAAPDTGWATPHAADGVPATGQSAGGGEPASPGDRTAPSSDTTPAPDDDDSGASDVDATDAETSLSTGTVTSSPTRSLTSSLTSTVTSSLTGTVTSSPTQKKTSRPPPMRESRHALYQRLIQESTRVFFAQGGTRISGTFQSSGKNADAAATDDVSGLRETTADAKSADKGRFARGAGAPESPKFFTTKKMTNSAKHAKESTARKTSVGRGDGTR